MMLLRGALLGLCLAVPAWAQPLDCAAMARLLWPGHAAEPGRCAASPWDDDLTVVAVLDDEVEIRAGLLRQGRPVATGRIEALTLAPPWATLLAFERLPWLAPGAIGIALTNGYFSTSNSLTSESLHILLRRGDVLLPVLAVLRRAGHSHASPCRPGQARPCRAGWTRRWRLGAAGPASDAAPPPVTVRDNRSGAIVSRHRWTGQGYAPAVFDRTPPVPPG